MPPDLPGDGTVTANALFQASESSSLEDTRSDGNKTAANGKGDCLGSGVGIQLCQDLRDVEFGSIGGDEQFGGNLFVAQSGRKHLQNFVFARRKRFRLQI